MNHYAFSDIHGNGTLFDRILDTMNNSLSCQTIFCGDAADRGPDGYRIMKAMLQDNRFIYLKGNHEDLFVNAARDFRKFLTWKNIDITIERSPSFYKELTYEDDSIRNWLMNGGRSTFISWIKDGANMKIVNQIDELPTAYQYRDYDFCHAGCTMREWNNMNTSKMIWGRDHFIDGWFDNRFLVHGHTPVNHLPKFALKNSDYTRDWVPVTYNKRKIDLDTGTAYSGIISLYDLDKKFYITFAEEGRKLSWDGI